MKVLYKIAFLSILIVIIGIAILAISNIIRWMGAPDFGFGFRSATGIKVVGILRENGQTAGLQVGDHILSVNNKTYETYREFNSAKNWGPNDKNSYLIERDGRQFKIIITNIPYGFKRTFKESGLPFLVGLTYMLIGTIVFLMKPYKRTSWTFFISTINFGILTIFLFKVSTLKPYWLDNFIIFAYCFFPSTMIHLASSFPKERRIFRKHPLAQYLPYVVSSLLFVGIRAATPNLMNAPKTSLIVLAIYMVFGVLFFIGSNVHLRFWSKSEIVKRRARMILLGFAIAALLPVLDFAINALFHIYMVPGFNYYLPFFIAFPLFVGYSIVKHDLFDIDTIIKRTYGYVLTTATIAGIYGLIVLVSNLAFGGFEFAKTPLFPLIFILAVVFLFNPVRNRVQKIIDRVFYRLEYNYQDTVHKISESMRTLLGLDEIGKSIMDTALGTMFIDAGCVMLHRPDANEYQCLVHAGKRDEGFSYTDNGKSDSTESEKNEMAEEDTFKKEEESLPQDVRLAIDDPFIQKIGQQKKEVTIYDIQEDPFFEDQQESCQKVFKKLEATLIVPLIYENRLIGLISLGQKKSGKFYRQEDINLLNILANQGAVAIENALMVEEVIEKERMEEELSIAKDLQVSMLPSECPEIQGFNIAAFSESAREVGGDFYDFIEISENKSGIVIGDVTGKSVSGALVMSASRSIFRMLGEDKLTVSESMVRANRRTKKDIKTGMFVALLYAVLKADNKSLSLCSAGQTQPVFHSAKSGEATLVETKGDTFPLGILDEAQYEETQLPLEAGDKVILYTDGVVEAMNGQEEMFGFDRLLEVVKNSQTKTAEALLEEIKSKVNEFVAGVAQHDDITIIVIQAE